MALTFSAPMDICPAVSGAPSAPPDPGRGKRQKQVQYMTADGVRTWNGRRFLCVHGRKRGVCKDCGGSEVCEHGKQRSKCKECGGSQICEHGRQRSQCKECGGATFCAHGKRRNECKECGGASICEHGRIRSQCKACGGSQICVHGRKRSTCHDCGGSHICEHGKRRSECKDCGGSQICEHGRLRNECKDCGGSKICEHGKRRSDCKECGGGCRGGLHDGCPWGRSKISFYDNLCVGCFVARTEKTHPSDPRLAKANKFLRAKEHKVAEFLEQAFPQYRWTLNRMFATGVLQRPDAKAVLGRERLLIVEIDEHSHRDRRCASEREREALFKQHAPRGATVFLVRINPDAYDDRFTGERVRGCFVRCKREGHEVVPPERADEWARRLEALRKTVQEIIDYRHEDVASFFPDWLREEDDRYANVHPIELFYDAVREKYGVDGDRGMVEGMKRAAKAKAAAAPAAVGGKRQVDEVDSDTTDDESCAPR